MTTKLEGAKEKLADATRKQQRAEWDLRAATGALRQFDQAHKVLDATSSKERERLVNAETHAAEALRDAKDAFNFCHHEHFAMMNEWGRSPGKWWRGDRKYEER
jgi:hypothetical protein